MEESGTRVALGFFAEVPISKDDVRHKIQAIDAVLGYDRQRSTQVENGGAVVSMLIGIQCQPATCFAGQAAGVQCSSEQPLCEHFEIPFRKNRASIANVCA